MKTTDQQANFQVTLRTGQKQSMRQRYVLVGISVLLLISACVLYYMIQQTEANAGVKVPVPKQEVKFQAVSYSLEAELRVEDNVPVLIWEGAFPAGAMFSVERKSADGQWDLIQKAPKEEVMAGSGEFRFSDYESEGGPVVYRITASDANGTALTTKEVSGDVPVNSLQLLEITGMEPLPFKDHFTITLNAKKEEVISFEISNYTGSVVYNEVYKVVPGTNLIGFTRGDNLPSGIYVIRLSGSGNALAMTKLIKQ